MSQHRALVASCPDWAVISAGRQPSNQVAVVLANRVVATSPAARAAGVRVGMRRREAQGRCPDLEVLLRDLPAEARQWEPAVAAVEAFAPGVEVLHPGQLALGARGPSRYFGGDMALAAKVAAAVEAVVAGVPGASGDGEGSRAGGPGPVGASAWAGCCKVGIADGLFAAGLAARLSPAGEGLVVAKGGNAEFLAPLPVKVLDDRAALADLLVRLGLKTLGDFAALPAPSVLGRFGPEGLSAHRLARGLAERPVRGRVPPPDWVVAAELDPPADQLQAAAFLGKALADELHGRLAGAGLVCTRLAIEAETEYGTSLRRSWRHDGALSAGAIGERVRWQLEGWAQASQAAAAQAGRITRLALIPEEVRPDDGRQLGFWGNDAGAASRAARALARVQGLLGPEEALTAVLQGGRDYTEQVLLVPWGEPRVPLRPGSPPWPGRLPGVAPAIVHQPPLPAQVLDEAGDPVSVASRGNASAPPALLRIGGGASADLVIGAWAGPWPLEERWWDSGGRRRARFQVSTADGGAYLLAREGRRWWVEATYD
jgi:protein ImuB